MGLTKDALRPRSDAGRGRRSGGEEDAARPRVIRRGIDSGGAAMKGAAVLRLHRRTAHGRKTQLGPGCVASELGKAARREAASPRCDRRSAHGRKTQLGPGCVASELGEAARREAASPRCDPGRRMTEDAAWPRACPVLDTGVNGVQGERAARRDAASLLETADRRMSKLRPWLRVSRAAGMSLSQSAKRKTHSDQTCPRT